MTNQEHENRTTPKRAKSRIPHFKSVEEEAEFWDTHDLTEFEDELEVVNDVRFVVMRGGTKKALTVRLPEDTLKTLAEQAHQMGVGSSTLVRMWVMEHLMADRKAARQSRSG